MFKTIAILFLLQAAPSGPLLENDFVRVFRDSAPCAAGAPSCGDRIFVALGPLELNGQKLERGNIRVFKAGEAYGAPRSGEYLEASIKPRHPKVAAPKVGTPPPPGNKVLFDGSGDFIVFEETMQPGEYSPPHSHNQRLAIFLNKVQVQQWVDGKSEMRDEEPDEVIFRPAVVHASKDLSAVPVRNILIEFKP